MISTSVYLTRPPFLFCQLLLHLFLLIFKPYRSPPAFFMAATIALLLPTWTLLPFQLYLPAPYLHEASIRPCLSQAEIHQWFTIRLRTKARFLSWALKTLQFLAFSIFQTLHLSTQSWSNSLLTIGFLSSP
jgi:hypothetical protein